MQILQVVIVRIWKIRNITLLQQNKDGNQSLRYTVQVQQGNQNMVGIEIIFECFIIRGKKA
jgi:hypothetical protein